MWRKLGSAICIRALQTQQQKQLAQRINNFTTTSRKSMAADDPVEPQQKGAGQPAQPAPLEVPPKMRANPALKKIDTAEFHSLFSDELKALIDIFKRHNHELRIAGGAVRDLLMELAPKDIDLATTATPDEMKAMFEREQVRLINEKGERHGTITPRIHNKENFEVTTLRIDVLTDGRHAEVQFTTDWQLDANRRDLTINSMFLGTDGTLYDYFYGYEDLEQRLVRFVGAPDVRIREDYLRILRYFRFYGRIARQADAHDAATLAAIREQREGLARISGERIWNELQKIVVGRFGRELVEEMIGCELAPFCGLPAAPNLDEFRRVCADLAAFDEAHYPVLFLIALLHTAEDAMRLHERLKLSAFERDLVLFITQNRDKVDKDFSTLHDFQKLCVQPYAKREYVEQLLKYSNKAALYEALRAWPTPTFPLNGNLLKAHGCPQGRKMGFVMGELKVIWADSDFTRTADELLDKHLPPILEKVKTLQFDAASPAKKQRKS